MDEIRVRIISQERGMYKVSNGVDIRNAEVSGKYIHEVDTVSDYPAVGDYVIASWPQDGSNSIISMLFPRRSCFIRKAAGKGKQEQVVASNIDTVFVCMALNKDFSIRRLERYISITWDSGAIPVVVLTKSDLCDDIPGRIREVEEIAFGIDVITISSINDDYEAVRKYLKPGKTVAFIGSSGVGKSTLINKLIGFDLIDTNGLRNDDKGRHTTTHRELIELPNGACVIDTPGMRELGMWDNEGGIESAFADVEELARRCRFSDCSHNNEPGCAVRRAIEIGELSIDRYYSFIKLSRENEYASDGSRYLEAKEAKFREISKINRNNKKK